MDVRSHMESSLGHSFGNVRIHADAPAASHARALDARAFTVGRDIYFGDGEYSPSSSAGRALIRHELGHVVEQRSGPIGVQCMKIGTGSVLRHGVMLDEPPENEKPRVQAAIDRLAAIVDDLLGHSGCHAFFKDRSATGETLRHAFDRAVVWKHASADGAGALTFPGEDNIAYTPDGYRLGGASLAEQLIHELGHVAGIGLPGSRAHGAADEIRVACLGGASAFFRFRGGVDVRGNALAALGFRWLVASLRRGRDELRLGLDVEVGGAARALDEQGTEPGEIGAASVGLSHRFRGGEKWGGWTLFGEGGIGAARFRLRAPDTNGEERKLGAGLVVEIGARKEFFVRNIEPSFEGRQTGAGVSIGYRAIIPLTPNAAEAIQGFYLGFDWAFK
jgi:hypothetical protein